MTLQVSIIFFRFDFHSLCCFSGKIQQQLSHFNCTYNKFSDNSYHCMVSGVFLSVSYQNDILCRSLYKEKIKGDN